MKATTRLFASGLLALSIAAVAVALRRDTGLWIDGTQVELVAVD
jgi:hypothetical protein